MLEYFIQYPELPLYNYSSFNDTVNIDEKWFYISKVKQRMYL